MKQCYSFFKTGFSVLAMVFLFSTVKSQSFTAGNIAVIVAAASANNTTASIVELNPALVAQTPVTTRNIDGTTLPNALRFSGSATSTLYLTNSDDGSLLAFTGANTTTSGATNINTILPRAVATYNAAGTFNLAATYTGASGNQARSATTINNSTWFIGDQGGVYTNGTSTPSPVLNLRGIKSFGGHAYVSQASGTATNIQVSTLSAPSGGTVTGLPGLTNNANLQDYYLISSGSNGTAFDVLYVVSATSNTLGSISKYSLVTGSWVANGTYATTFGGFGLAAKKNGAGADLFVSTGQGALTANNLLKLNDVAGYNAAISITTANNVILYTAGTGTIIKGVAFAPVAVVANPSVSLTVSSNTGTEAGTTAITVTATATAAVTGTQTVDLAVTGTGITTGDYNLTGNTITIANGATTGTVTFTVVDDILVEGTETATLTISNPSAGITLGSPLSQNIVITDNDVALPTVNLSVSTNTGSEQNETVVTVTATASAPVSGNQTVSLAVTGAGITASDYMLSATTITIANGQTTGTVTFKIRNDAEQEGIETAVLTISNPSAGITLGTPTTQNVSIDDNTCQPIIRKSTATSANGAEISAFDPSTNRVFTVAGPAMEYYTLSNTGILSAPINMSIGFTSAGNNIVPNSVGVRNGIVAVAYAIVNSTTNAQQPGVVAFYDAATATYISQVAVGFLPDMLIYSPDGTKILTANEGEPNSYGNGNSFDPEGSVSIINIAGGVNLATVNTVGFTGFNGDIATLRAAGVRIYGPGATVAQDFEPEYISFSGDGSKAFVTLQENNAVAELDMTTSTFTQIIPLGLKDHSLPGNGFDASDRDSTTSLGRINIQNWPVFGMYQPDATASFVVGGNTYYITANEGDSRDYPTSSPSFTEEVRVSAGSYILDPAIFPNATTLKLPANIGRMQLTNATGSTDGDSEFEQIHAFGARSFSIWNSTFSQIYDSGDQLEQITAAQNPGRFNADNTDNTSATFDTRSDNKGPEPEAVTTGTVNGVLYAFVGIERSGDIFVYDITNPAAPVFKQYIDNTLDFGVEGLVFVPANQSPTGKPLLISSAEVSRTVTVYEFSLVANNLVAVSTTITAVQDSVSSYGDCTGLIARVAKNGAAPIAGSVAAKVYVQSSVPSYNSVPYVQRHYEITPAANATTATGRVTLYFTQTEFNNFNADPNSTLDLPTAAGDASGKANLLVIKYPGESSDGSGLPATYTGPATIINPDDAAIVYNAAAARWEVSFDVTGFSGFFVQTNATVLPVTLLSFTAKPEGDNSILVWNVSNEINHAGYEVQYSKEGRTFIDADFVNGTNTAGNKTYNFIHENAAFIAEKLFYRLKIISTSGTFTYSDIEIVRFGKTDKLISDLYPTPTTGILHIVSNANNTKPITINIFDVSGRRLTATMLNNSSNNTIDITNYAKGIYLLEASTIEGRKQQFKIVKQ